MKVNKTKLKAHTEQVSRFGEDLRALRRAQKLKLADLAEMTGKSVGYLSKVERGLARPSVTALQEIAQALGVPVGWFFDSDGPVPADERPFIVRKDRRRKLTYSGITDTEYMGFKDHLLSATLDSQLALGISTYDEGGSTGDDAYTHEGEEAGYLLEGRIVIELDGKHFELEPGDSFSFSANIPHRYFNPGPGPAKLIWANTPISLKR